MLDKDYIIKEFELSGLSEEAQNQQIEIIRETVQLRLGPKLIDSMDEDQQKTFEELISSGKNVDALQWLTDTFPDYKDRIIQELRTLKEETQSISQQALET